MTHVFVIVAILFFGYYLLFERTFCPGDLSERLSTLMHRMKDLGDMVAQRAIDEGATKEQLGELSAYVQMASIQGHSISSLP